jgi:hypothetical protein
MSNKHKDNAKSQEGDGGEIDEESRGLLVDP